MPSVLTADGFEIVVRWDSETYMFEVEIFDTENVYREETDYHPLIFFAAAETVAELDNTIQQFGFYINDTLREAVERDQRRTENEDKVFELFAQTEGWNEL